MNIDRVSALVIGVERPTIPVVGIEDSQLSVLFKGATKRKLIFHIHIHFIWVLKPELIN